MKPADNLKRLRRAATLLLIAASLFTTVASAAAYLNDPGIAKLEFGRIRTVGPEGKLVIDRTGQDSLTVAVNIDAAITKDRAPAVFESLAEGDVVRIRLMWRRRGRPRVVGVDADGLVVAGTIVAIDRNRSKLTIRGLADKTVEIQPQTVILWDSALASLAELKPGMRARAEYDSVEHSKLMRLKVGG